MFGGISRDCERDREIWEVKDWLGSECSFQCSKGIIARAVPEPGVSLFGEVKEGMGDIRVVGHEVSIEVCKP